MTSSDAERRSALAEELADARRDGYRVPHHGGPRTGPEAIPPARPATVEADLRLTVIALSGLAFDLAPGPYYGQDGRALADIRRNTDKERYTEAARALEGPRAEHGTRARRRQGCDCVPCKEAAAAAVAYYSREYRARKRRAGEAAT